jgi:hypothetical protein
VIGIILLAQFAVGVYGSRSMKDDPAMSPEAVAKRIAPVREGRGRSERPAARPRRAPGCQPPRCRRAPPRARRLGQGDLRRHLLGPATAPASRARRSSATRPRGRRASRRQRRASRLRAQGQGRDAAQGRQRGLSDDAVKAAVDYMVATAK